MKKNDLEKIKSVYEIFLAGWSNNEKKIAKDILNKFCKIYDITFDELVNKIWEIDIIEEHFEVPKEHNKLIHQIIYKVMWHLKFKINDSFSKKKNFILLECNEKEKNEINKLIKFYFPIYKKDLELFLKEKEKEFFKAFVHKNKIVPADKIRDISDLSLDWLNEILKMYETMEDLKEYNFPDDKKQLNSNLTLC